MPVHAITGASGHVGRYAVHQLLARGVPPSVAVAVVRTRDKGRFVRSWPPAWALRTRSFALPRSYDSWARRTSRSRCRLS
jgi:uncharacterized protein YbjT (DUF2867 family)